ncbi:MAG: hypothetical protein J2P21_08950 [Chloracidobacterium sp.]|nr:hypothetical protein [Chloracidobacterium sp.]
MRDDRRAGSELRLSSDSTREPPTVYTQPYISRPVVPIGDNYIGANVSLARRGESHGAGLRRYAAPSVHDHNHRGVETASRKITHEICF